MKLKTIITIVLLIFIFASVAYLVVKEVCSAASQPPPAETDLHTVAQPDGSPSKADDSKVVLYYFYGNVRCPTCRKFESFSDESLREAFSEELNDGRLEWRTINVDEPGNKHFVSDYQLYSKSIVVVQIRDGQQTDWKNLNRIWELVRNKGAFIKYVQDEVRDYLGTE